MKKAACIFILALVMVIPALIFGQTLEKTGSCLPASYSDQPASVWTNGVSDTVFVGAGDSLLHYTITSAKTFRSRYVFAGGPVIKDITRSIDYVITSMSDNRIAIINIPDMVANTAVPVNIYLGGQTAKQIEIAGDSLYAILDNNTVKVWDMSAITSPVLKYTSPVFTNNLNEFVITSGTEGDTLWLLEKDSLRIIDITNNYSDLDTVSSFGFTGTPELNSLLMNKGNASYYHLLYIAGDLGVYALDISDPVNPVLSDTYSGSYKKFGGIYSTQFFYVQHNEPLDNVVDKIQGHLSGSLIFSSSIKIHPTGRVTDFSHNYSLANLIVTVAQDGFYDLASNGSFTSYTSTYPYKDNIDVTATNTHMYAACRIDGIRIYNYSMTNASKTISLYTTKTSAAKDYTSVQVYNGYLLAGHQDGVEVYGINNANGSLTWKNDYSGIGGFVKQLAVKDTVLIAVTGTKVRLYNLMDLPNLSTLTDIANPNVSDVRISGHNLYMSVNNPAGSNDGLAVKDISNPAAPVTVTHDFSALGYFQQWKSIAVSEDTNTAYIAVGDSVVSLDLSTHTELDTFCLGTADGSFNDLILKGDYLMAANDSFAVYVIDVSDPAAMTQKTSLAFTDSIALKKMYMNGYSLFAVFEDGVQMVRNPFGTSLFESGRFLSYKDADTVSLKIKLMNDLSQSVSDTNIYSFEFKIRFDTMRLDTIADANGYAALDSIGTILDASGFLVSANRMKDTVIINGAGSLPLGSGPGQFINVLFKTKSGVGQGDTAYFHFEHSLLNDGFPHASVKKGYLKFKPHFGDVSGESGITSFDASLVLQHAVRIITMGLDSVNRAEVSGNGTINAFDAGLIMRYAAGYVNSFPAENTYLQKPAPEGYGNTELKYALDYGGEGKFLSVPVSIKNAESIYAMEIELDFTGTAFTGYTLDANVKEYVKDVYEKDGNLKFAFAGAVPVKESEMFVTFHFKVENENISENIHFKRIVLNETDYSLSDLKQDNNLPVSYKLHQNFPNPFNPVTTIKYDLPKNSRVTLKIYNILGQEIKTLVNEHKRAGFHRIKWDGTNRNGLTAASGIYLYRIKAENYTNVRKMVYIK